MKLRTATFRLFTAAALAVVSVVGLSEAPANATLPGAVVEQGDAFDSCGLPSLSDMSTWWSNTGYEAIGVYIGGVNAACNSVTESWLSSVMAQGWDVWLIWVGLQNNCVNQSGLSTYSTNANTAQNQGESEAQSAVKAAKALGFGANTYIYYDMEAFNTSNSTCSTDNASFVNGWAYEMQTALGEHGGVYGSSCGSDLNDDHGHSNVPQAVYPADWGTETKSVYGLDCLPDTVWDHDQRIHQFQGGDPIVVPSGDPTFNVDEDCMDGPVQGNSTTDMPCSGQ